MSRNLCFKIVGLSLALGIFSGTGFVALHFPAPVGEEAFHVSQTAESIFLSLSMTIFWGLLCIVGSLCASFKNSPKQWLRTWIIAMIMSLAIGLLIANFLGYSAFMGEERDWFKTHDRFVLQEYIAMAVQFGICFGGLAAACLAFAATVLIALAFLVSRWRSRHVGAAIAQKR